MQWMVAYGAQAPTVGCLVTRSRLAAWYLTAYAKARGLMYTPLAPGYTTIRPGGDLLVSPDDARRLGFEPPSFTPPDSPVPGWCARDAATRTRWVPPGTSRRPRL